MLLNGIMFNNYIILFTCALCMCSFGITDEKWINVTIVLMPSIDERVGVSNAINAAMFYCTTSGFWKHRRITNLSFRMYLWVFSFLLFPHFMTTTPTNATKLQITHVDAVRTAWCFGSIIHIIILVILILVVRSSCGNFAACQCSWQQR